MKVFIFKVLFGFLAVASTNMQTTENRIKKNVPKVSHTSLERADYNFDVVHINCANDDILVEVPIENNVKANFDQLVWSDEFDGSGAIDAAKWHHQTLLPN